MPAATRPNIIVILADDMGYADIGCFGSEIRTPNLDKLANGGIRFSQMYNGARCCPTRASLLTGLYAHQAGVGHMIGDWGVGPAYQGYLRKDAVTIGEVLGASGYRTCYSGKWHASPGIPISPQPQGEIGAPSAPEVGSDQNPYPLSRGFDRFYGTLCGATSFFNPHALMEQDKRISAVDDPDYYYTDAISDNASKMIEESADEGKPFFLHVCYTAPHWPLHAKPEDIEKYRSVYRKGWDHFRTARHEELKGMGVLSNRWDISPRDGESRDFFADSVARQEWEALRMAVYAAQVESMDRGIGRIINTLKRRSIEENTIVMFLSDNGGCAEFLQEDGEDTAWPGMYARTARPGEVCTVGNIEGMEPGSNTTFMSYDLPWANVSNSPFRRYKHWVHEGGIATPFVFNWPGHTPAGEIRHRPCHIIDIMATCVDAGKAQYPRTFNGNDIQPLEGESMLPLVAEERQSRVAPLFFEHEGNRAVRDGEWKLVSIANAEWELYNMIDDRTELNNLAKAQPGKAVQLAGLYEDWACRCGVLPWPPK